VTRWTKQHTIAASTALLIVLAIVDHVTGVEVTFVELTYLLPIAAVTWIGSRSVGFVFATFATTCTLYSLHVHAHPPAAALALNAIGVFGMFAATIMILDALRRHVERERMQRRAAVEQLRHAERLNVIGTLAAGMAHEIGTPLNVISGAAELLEEREVTLERRTELTATILRQTEKITALIRHLLEFGRRARTSTTEVAIDGPVASAVDMLAATARKRGVVLRFDARAGERVRARATKHELEQVVSNLVLNGVQAMAHGGVLEVATAVTERDGHERALITVTDQGRGIAKEHLPYIFDPFFTTKGVGEGTGLGLSVSYGIVSDWGGSFEVSSQPGVGTTFSVLLPVVESYAS